MIAIANISISWNLYKMQEENDKEMMLKYIDTFEDVLTRENRMCHFTASNQFMQN